MNDNEHTPKSYLIMEPDGKTKEISSMPEYQDECFSKLVSLHTEERVKPAFTSHMTTMQDLGLVGYESASDKGHYRYLFRGTLICELIRCWLKNEIQERFNALEIRTPFIYDWRRKDVQGQAGLFSNDIYHVYGSGSSREFVLKYGGDAGVFSIIRDARLNYSHLPFRLFEDCNGFRITPTGAISGIRRGRAFSFPDIHSFCSDFESGLEEYCAIFALHLKLASDLGIEIATVFKLPWEFLPKAKAVIGLMANQQKKPVLLELASKQKQYWTMKNIGFTNHPQKLFHIQLDLENGERYMMSYTDKSGTKKPLVVIHNSLGSIEKWVVLTIEEALRKNPPVMPLWLSPTQLRLIPVKSDLHTTRCLELASEHADKIRIDVDDRNISIAKRIKLAEKDWVPFTIAIGDSEIRNGTYNPRARGGAMSQMSWPEIIQYFSDKTAGKPYKNLPEKRLSKIPKFK